MIDSLILEPCARSNSVHYNRTLIDSWPLYFMLTFYLKRKVVTNPLYLVTVFKKDKTTYLSATHPCHISILHLHLIIFSLSVASIKAARMFVSATVSYVNCRLVRLPRMQRWIESKKQKLDFVHTQLRPLLILMSRLSLILSATLL